jgi:hypothetical protein
VETVRDPHRQLGEFARFVAYVGTLNWFVPVWLWPLLAVLSTAAELVLGLLLLLGLWTRTAAILSALLLALFALEMAVGVGPGVPCRVGLDCLRQCRPARDTARPGTCLESRPLVAAPQTAESAAGTQANGYLRCSDRFLAQSNSQAPIGDRCVAQAKVSLSRPRNRLVRP